MEYHSTIPIELNDENLKEAMLSNPNAFMEMISKSDYLTLNFAKFLDKIDPLSYTATLFDIDHLYPFAGHSLGPLFQPALEKIKQIANLQKSLHAGHFSATHPEGKESANWFDCDRHEPSLKAVQQILGFEHQDEFIFTANGLSDNLAKLLDTFFRPSKKDWKNGKTHIVMLATEFFSDQAAVVSVIRRAIKTAEQFDIFPDGNIPDPESLIIRILPQENGIYKTEDIIATIKNHADKIQLICFSDIVFNTGQRLELTEIFSQLKNSIQEHNIMIGLDLAHTIGNRPIHLADFPVKIHFAVACGYKHLCGFAGSSFGMYVNKDIDLQKYPPLQGWKAADSHEVFATIHQFDARLMAKSGALAFRTSNPQPIALTPAQVFLTYFANIGFNKCFNKSECLTQYLIAQLKKQIGDRIEFITPLHPKERGAMIVFRIKGLQQSVDILEEELRKTEDHQPGYEIDVRPPNNIRISAHYAYTKFEHIVSMVNKLKLLIS